MSNLAEINIDEIDTTGRLRPVDVDYVNALAGSIAELGLQSPIKLRWKDDDGYALVFGMHRLEAMKTLGWSVLERDIHYVVESLTVEQARVAEIDENLFRHDLNPLDRAIFLAERKHIYEQMHPETAQGKAKKPKNGKSQTLRAFLPPRFSLDAANKIGMSERSIQLAIDLANRLDPAALEALRKTPIIHNQAALQKFAEETPENQRLIAAKMAADGVASLQEAKVSLKLAEPVKVHPAKRDFLNLIYLWQKADKSSRAGFMEFVELERRGKAKDETAFEIARRIFPNEENGQ